ncbi:L-idonate 5-dehydrogenase [Trichinella spiralis]|uniref:L-idonate 5-dehydrogenase n=1 Tax=Trichinella spiralis TaxID=6334 RepID=A0ABR3KK64_TRISP
MWKKQDYDTIVRMIISMVDVGFVLIGYNSSQLLALSALRTGGVSNWASSQECRLTNQRLRRARHLQLPLTVVRLQLFLFCVDSVEIFYQIFALKIQPCNFLV